jgi:hydroxyacid-oxoacid transhydrogenase
VVAYDRVSVEPTDRSFVEAIAFAREQALEAIAAAGGGSTIDTAKAINLYVSYPPADFLDYVNPPVGKGLPVPGALRPLMAVPTTAGTGSETTGVAVFDHTGLRVKTGMSNRRLKPTLGFLDPDNTRTMPRSGGFLDRRPVPRRVTAVPFTGRPRPAPRSAPAYQGANPISDVGRSDAVIGRFFVRAVEDPSDDEARAQMLLAASRGIGFGTAGVHLPTPCCPCRKRLGYRAPGYATDHALVPHGLSVV